MLVFLRYNFLIQSDLISIIFDIIGCIFLAGYMLERPIKYGPTLDSICLDSKCNLPNSDDSTNSATNL